MLELRVVESAEYIASTSTHVHLGDDAHFASAAALIGPLVQSWQAQSWTERPLHPTVTDPSVKAAWIFLIDTLNFAFWTPPDAAPFTVVYQDQPYTGYWSLCASILRALDDHKPILDSSFWVQSTVADWQQIFRSDSETPIALLERRVSIISEAGKFLRDRFSGSAYEMVKSVHGSAVKLADLIRSNLLSYRDECEYQGKTVYFLKRAQILVADMHFGQVEAFSDIDQITMFADYRVPQVLNYLGLISYSDFLMNELKTRPHLKAGSQIECEIRGLSIAAVERLKTFIGPKAIAVLIDYALWDYAKANSQLMAHIPVHKTEGIFY
jgi:hypothetical protein